MLEKERRNNLVEDSNTLDMHASAPSTERLKKQKVIDARPHISYVKERMQNAVQINP